MSVHQLLTTIHDSGIATSIREGDTAFPWIESFHVLAVVSVVGTIAIIDMRLLGIPGHIRGVRRLMRNLLPFTWGAFLIALITGTLLFISRAPDYAENTFFLIKMGLLLLAGANMAFFHVLTQRTMHIWDEMLQTPYAAKMAGLSSLALWTAVIACGRWIGFTLEATK